MPIAKQKKYTNREKKVLRQKLDAATKGKSEHYRFGHHIGIMMRSLTNNTTEGEYIDAWQGFLKGLKGTEATVDYRDHIMNIKIIKKVKE